MNINTATQLFIDAKNDYVEVQPGVYLDSREVMLDEQKNWSEFDHATTLIFTDAPYYITTDSDASVEEIYDEHDLINLIGEGE